MIIIKRNVKRKTLENGMEFTSAKLSVDEICQGNTPYTNMYTFCLLNDLLKLDEESQTYLVTLTAIDLEWSKDKEKNNTVKEMLQKMDVWII